MPATRPLSFLTLKATVRSSPLGGMGIFATEPIPQHEMVAFWSGHAITSAELEALDEETREYPVQVWFDTFLGPTRMDQVEAVDYMNHSCEPTCGIKGSVVVVARRDIGAGEELTFDYGTTDTVGLVMECSCGTPSCRHVVTSNDWRDPEFRRRNAGYLSLYVELLVAHLESGRPIIGMPAEGIPALRPSWEPPPHS